VLVDKWLRAIDSRLHYCIDRSSTTKRVLTMKYQEDRTTTY